MTYIYGKNYEQNAWSNKHAGQTHGKLLFCRSSEESPQALLHSLEISGTDF